MHRSKLPDEGITIFAQMSALARKLNAINLGQGFPDFTPDKTIIEHIRQAFLNSTHQYAPMKGNEKLRHVLAEKINYFQKTNLTENNITITAGATQAIFCAITAFVHPGDEVIILDPGYDSYRPSVLFNSGVPAPVLSTPPLFKPDFNKIKDAITDKTRIIIVNTPNNPGTHIWTKQDWETLAEILSDREDIIVLSDEVYEHIVFDGRKHVSVLSIDGLKQRAIAVYSFGKTFHATGWKIGYAVALEPVIIEFDKIHQYVVYAVNNVMQEGLASYLEWVKQTKGFDSLDQSHFFEKKRDFLYNALTNTRLKPIKPEGTYFMLADYSALSQKSDMEFVIDLAHQIGVVTIPLSPLFINPPENLRMIRFCFAKREETLQQAVEKLSLL
ncbi:MAG: aminotransferase class I/II-fold pyridoxal phosphate-dependent enzyme [Chlorobi bacterium]|nr:aminotransferase class I/II-fold pyridoxal phosphate-dependent enzyme [Chlorobiota bacterium]